MNSFSLKFSTYYRLRWTDYVILFALLFLSFYFGLSSYAIENLNEGLYAEIPREMLEIGNYIIPNLNFVPYIEKPPLFYWLIAISYKLFGISAWSARVVPATAASAICLNLVYFGNLIRRNREGWLAAIILATSIGFIAIARVLIFDMVLTFFFSAALLSFYHWYKQTNIKSLRFFYLFVGLALLTKGLLALLLPLIALVFIAISPRGSKRLLSFFDPIGALLFLMVVIPWHYLAIKQQAGFAWNYFINEQYLRFFDQRIPHDYHTGSIFFYIPRLLIYLFPWSLLSFLLLKPEKSVDQSLSRFLWLWLLIPLLFFSLAKAKGDYYMVIATPALALLLALKINEQLTRPNSTLFYFFLVFATLELLTIGLAFFATAKGFLLNYLPKFLWFDASFSSILLYLWLSVMAITLVGAICNFYSRKPLVKLHLLLIASLVITLIIFYILNKQQIQNHHSETVIANYIQQHDNQCPVFLFKDCEKISSIMFYLKRRLPIIDSQSQDLYFGMRNITDKNWFISLGHFMMARQQEHYVIARKKNFLEFMHSVVPQEYCIVAQSGSSVLLSNKRQDCN